MGIKFSVGMSDLHEDRRALEELRRRSPAGSSTASALGGGGAAARRGTEKKREAGAPGWPLQASPEEEPAVVPGQSLWAW
jgi:hypothetical protein